MHTWRFSRNSIPVLHNILFICVLVFWTWEEYRLNNDVSDWKNHLLAILPVSVIVILCLYVLWRQIKILIYALESDEFIRLAHREIQYRLYPVQGRLPYSWITYLDYRMNYRYLNENRVTGGVILIEYHHPDIAGLRRLKLDISRIIPQPESFFRSSKDLERTIEEVFQAIVAHVPESQRYTQEEYKQLGPRNKNYL